MARRKARASQVPFGQQQKAGFFKGTPQQQVMMSTNTPQQQSVLDRVNQYLSGGIGNLNLPGGQSNFAPIAEQSQRNFQQQTVPTLAERFGSLGSGSGGALSSPDLYKQLGAAGANLQGDLAALQSQYGLQERGEQANNFFNLLGAGLKPQFDYGITPEQSSGIRNIWNSVKQPAANAALGFMAGGPAGAGLGALSGLMQNQQQPLQQQFQQPQQMQQQFQQPQQQFQQPQQSMLGTSGLNNTILQGFGQNMLPQSNLLFQNRQF